MSGASEAGGDSCNAQLKRCCSALQPCWLRGRTLRVLCAIECFTGGCQQGVDVCQPCWERESAHESVTGSCLCSPGRPPVAPDLMSWDCTGVQGQPVVNRMHRTS